MGLLECSADVFERLRKTWGEGDEIFILQVSATFSSEDEPQESVAHVTFLSMVQLFLSTEGMAVLKNWTAFYL